MKKLLFLFSLLSILVCTSYAQSKFTMGFEAAMTLSAISYKDAPMAKPYLNYYKNWVLPQVSEGTFSFKPHLSLGFTTRYQFTPKIATINTLNIFIRSFNAGESTTSLHAGIASLLQYKPLDKYKNFYVLGGLRLDKMLDYDAGGANAILDYVEKEYEVSPIIGIGYEKTVLSWLKISTDLRFNYGVKNLLGNVPWHSEGRYDSHANFQMFWLNTSFWFGKQK